MISTRSDKFLLSAWLDALLLGGGSILTFLLLAVTGWDSEGAKIAIVAGWLSWVVNWPHFSATLQRLIRSPESRSEFPLTVYALPPLLLLAVASCFAYPDSFAPFFIKLYLIWSPYHFSGQTLGVTLIYARRNDIRLTPAARWLLSTFIFGTFAYSALDVESLTQGGGYYGISYPSLGVPPQVVPIVFWGMCLAGVGFLFLFRRSAKGKGAACLMVLLPAVAQLTWFVLSRKNLAFYALVPFFHSLQYLPIVWAMGMAERKKRGELAPSEFKVESWFWYGANVMGGIGLFHILPRAVTVTGVSLELATGIVLAAVQIHHFFVDGVVWKLKSTRVSAALTRNVRNVVETTG